MVFWFKLRSWEKIFTFVPGPIVCPGPATMPFVDVCQLIGFFRIDRKTGRFLGAGFKVVLSQRS